MNILEDMTIFRYRSVLDQEWWIHRIIGTDVYYNSTRNVWIYVGQGHNIGIKVDLDFVLDEVLKKCGPESSVYTNVLFNLDELRKL